MLRNHYRPAMTRIWSDPHKYDVWLKIEVLVCEAWARLGRIPADALDRIRQRASVDPQRIDELSERLGNECNAFLLAVGETLGSDASYLHMGILAADVRDTALSYRMAEAGRLLFRGFGRLRRSLGQQARRHAATIMAGRIHGVQEQPTTLGLKLGLLYDEVERAAERVAAAIDGACVGTLSGNVGIYNGAPPAIEDFVCQRLQLSPLPASGQSLNRDHHAAVLSSLALAGGTLERAANTLRLLQQTEVHEVLEPAPKASARRSVLWPERGARASEKVVSIARLLRGHALSAMEGQARWHEHDGTHELAEAAILPTSFLLLDWALDRLTAVFGRLAVNEARMRENLERTEASLVSGRLLDALTRAGCDNEESHRLLQKLARSCAKNGSSFCEALRREDWVTEQLDEACLADCLSLAPYVRHAEWSLAQLGLQAEAPGESKGKSTKTGKARAPRKIGGKISSCPSRKGR